jgi:indolepyruvate ferredoxin oxidoreductase
VNSHEIITGDFTRDTDFKLPADQLRVSLEARLQDKVAFFDASDLAKALMGDSIYSNMMIFGAAFQQGAIPLTLASIEQAITLNGTAIERNKHAFALGRWAYLYPVEAAKVVAPNITQKPKTLAEKITFRADHLTGYQNKKLARKYQTLVASFTDPALQEAVALGYHKLLSYKDEYEVARLLQDTEAKARETFDGDLKLTYHLAPPMVTKTGPDGRPTKKQYGATMARMFPLLARFRRLRGTAFDPFGRTAERRMERALIAEYEADMAKLKPLITPQTRDAAIALAQLPLTIKGFGPVKETNARVAAKTRESLWSVINAGGVQQSTAAE